MLWSQDCSWLLDQHKEAVNFREVVEFKECKEEVDFRAELVDYMEPKMVVDRRKVLHCSTMLDLMAVITLPQGMFSVNCLFK